MINKLVMNLISCVAISAHASTTKEFRIGISQEFENLNPLIMTMSATTYIYST